MNFTRFRKSTDGVVLIEAALVMPFFLIILFGIIDFSRMYSARYQSQTLATTLSDVARAYQGGNPTNRF